MAAHIAHPKGQGEVHVHSNGDHRIPEPSADTESLRRRLSGAVGLVLVVLSHPVASQESNTASLTTPAEVSGGDERQWAVINIGNGFFQIRQHIPGNPEPSCLSASTASSAVMLRDCEAKSSGYSSLMDWSFDRLVGGGYQVVSRWADFYGAPACLAGFNGTTVGTVALTRCPNSDGRVRSMDGISQLLADPTER